MLHCDRSAPARSLRHQLAPILVGLCLVPAATGCVRMFDRRPGEAMEPGPDGLPIDACTDHYAATAFDGLLGTLALAGGLFGLALASTELAPELFLSVGLFGLGGAALHYESASSNQVERCQQLREGRSGARP